MIPAHQHSSSSQQSRFSLVKRADAEDLEPLSNAEFTIQSTHSLLKDGTWIFKPLQEQDSNGEQEMQFYAKIQGLRFAEFCPKYAGLTSIPETGTDYRFLQIEDCTAHCECPAVMDLKMGKKKFYAVARERGHAKRYPDAKIRRQAEADLQRTSGRLGWLVSGIKIEPCRGKPLLSRSEDFGKSAADTDAKAAVREFVSWGGASEQVASALLARLRAILTWYEREQGHVLYNASLLFVYDAANPQNADAIRIRFIDFCHAWELAPGEEDKSGVKDGVLNLIEVLEPMVKSSGCCFGCLNF
jgi:hypothetical protein